MSLCLIYKGPVASTICNPESNLIWAVSPLSRYNNNILFFTLVILRVKKAPSSVNCAIVLNTFVWFLLLHLKSIALHYIHYLFNHLFNHWSPYWGQGLDRWFKVVTAWPGSKFSGWNLCLSYNGIGVWEGTRKVGRKLRVRETKRDYQFPPSHLGSLITQQQIEISVFQYTRRSNGQYIPH